MICPFCKEEIVDGAIKCKHCQSMLADYDANTAMNTRASGETATVNALDWYWLVLKRYAVFRGRAQRAEYWYFMLFNVIASFVLGVIDAMFGTFNWKYGIGLLGTVYSLAVMLPSWGVWVRRLHDINKSGWWLLILLVPLVGIIVLIVFTVLDSKPGPNKYGPNPKGVLA